ncbi:neuralized-like protein 4 [Glandiceps talaboti]
MGNNSLPGPPPPSRRSSQSPSPPPSMSSYGPSQSRSGLLAQIHLGAALKHVDSSEQNTAAPTDAKGDLLNQIRQGRNLKTVELDSKPQTAGAHARDLASRNITIQGHSSGSSRKCRFKDTCGRYIDSLKIPDAFLDNKFDMCYCNRCHQHRGDKSCYMRGSPAKTYGVPIGWCRFGLKVPPRAEALNVFDSWHVAFHGTTEKALIYILETGDLLMPGDTLKTGEKLGECYGHYTKDNRPPGFDTEQIFLSPSIKYSGCNVYSKCSLFSDGSTGKAYKTKVVFQVLIEPSTYSVIPETIGAASQIDPLFDNDEIEWSTKRRGVVILYGLLVKLKSNDCPKHMYIRRFLFRMVRPFKVNLFSSEFDIIISHLAIDYVRCYSSNRGLVSKESKYWEYLVATCAHFKIMDVIKNANLL